MAKARGRQFILIHHKNAGDLIFIAVFTRHLARKEGIHFGIRNPAGALEQLVRHHLEPGKAFQP